MAQTSTNKRMANRRHNASPAQRRAHDRYRDRTMAVCFRVNPRTERDVYDRLRSVPCVAAYLKELVRRDVRGV